MYKFTKYFALVGLVIGLMACGDDSTGPDPSEAPSIPEVQSEAAQPDLSFFENNQPKIMAKGDTANYYQARNWAMWQGSTFAFAGTYSGFLMGGSDEEAVYDDGAWVWEYSYQAEEGSFSMKLTSEDVPGGYRWAMYWSYDDGETSVEDYKIMEGTVAEDGSEGNWTFNNLDSETNQEQVAYTSDWTVTSETESEMTVKWYDDSGSADFTANYDKNEPEHTMTYTYPDEPDITVYWNTETKEGYYDEEGNDRRCWNNEFQDVSCS